MTLTQEDITAIVQQVLAALLTNGKTISQLTAVQDVDDSDCFELSGGKKVSFSTLANVIIEQVGSIDNYTIVDYDGRDEVETFTYTKSSGVITLKQEGHNAKTITIATATTSRPGLMSATDKSNLDTTVGKVVSSLTRSRTSSNMDITITFADNTTKSVTLPYATTSYAGLMSAADKSNLDSAKTLATNLNNKLGAANGIAELDSNGKLKESQLPANVVTDLDAMQKADLISGFVKGEQCPRNVIVNIDSGADLSGMTHGDVFFLEGGLFWYDYTNNHGNRVSEPLGEPQDNVVYIHKSTGLMYKWNGSAFVNFGLDLDGNGRISSSQAAPQVMQSMGTTLDNVGNTGPTVNYAAGIGDTYFNPSSGKILYKKSADVTIDLGAPSALLIYANRYTNKLYRWNGSAMVELG